MVVDGRQMVSLVSVRGEVKVKEAIYIKQRVKLYYNKPFWSLEQYIHYISIVLILPPTCSRTPPRDASRTRAVPDCDRNNRSSTC